MQETSPTYSLLTVVWALNDENGKQRSVQSANLTLALSTDFDSTTSHVENSDLHKHLTAAIVIFVITFLVAIFTTIAIVVTIWMWKVRAGWKKKVQDAMASESQRTHCYNTRRICVATSRTKVRNSMVMHGVTTSSVHRTHSTIGFPGTAEFYFREHSSNFLEPNHSVSLPIIKCRSMPNLSQSQMYNLPIEDFLVEPRRNLNTVHTRVKILNYIPTKSEKNSNATRKRLLKTNTVDNLQNSRRQEVTPKLNNCNIAEDKLNTKKKRIGLVCSQEYSSQ